jgi:hypothetical protein
MNIHDPQKDIDYLVARNNTKDLAEAILIAILYLKDSEGKLLRVKLGETFQDQINFAMQIAKMLRGGRD